MGYTNYWKSKGFNQKQFGAIIRDIRTILKDEYFNKINLDELLINRSDIMFNGLGENEHETFYLNNKPTDFACCKTAKKPYDKLVQAVLIISCHYNPNFEFSSDGDFTDWKDTINKVDELLNIKGEIK